MHEVRATFTDDVSKTNHWNVGWWNDKTYGISTQITENCWKIEYTWYHGILNFIIIINISSLNFILKHTGFVCKLLNDNIFMRASLNRPLSLSPSLSRIVIIFNHMAVWFEDVNFFYIPFVCFCSCRKREKCMENIEFSFKNFLFSLWLLVKRSLSAHCCNDNVVSFSTFCSCFVCLLWKLGVCESFVHFVFSWN